MKKFNVKLLSMAVAAAVVSSAAGATEAEIKKDVDVLKLKTTELNQIVNGFAAGEDFVETNKTDGSKTIRKATDADVEADDLDGKGLVEAVFHVSEGLQEVSDTVDEVKQNLSSHEKAIKDNTAAINGTINTVTDISKEVVEHRKSLSDVNTRVDDLAQETAEALDEQDKTIKKLEDAITTNGTRIAEVATGVNELNKSVADMDKNFSDQFGEIGEDVTAVNTRVNSLAQDTADANAAAKAAAKAAADTALMAAENAQALNGFAEGDEIVVADKNGIKSIKTATKEDVENADFEGVGLKEIVEVHDKALDDLAKSVTENNDALAKTAAVVNDISADVNANKAAIETKADKTDVEAAQKSAEQAALASAENAQALNGFAEGDEIVVTDKNGIKSIKTATKEDVENADFEGMGLKGVVAAHDETLDDLTKAVTENSEALVKTAAVVNDISADVNANKAALEEQKEANEGFNNAIASLDKDIGDLASAGKAAMEALEVNRQDIDANKAAIETKADKADFEELAKYTADMGKKVNDIGDEVTALSDATNAAITRHDKDIVDLAQAGLKATEALEANRKDIDANKQGIVDLAKGLQLAAEAVEDNRKEIDANKAAIETKADKADFEELAKYTDNMGKKVNDIGDEVTALSDATSAAITRHDKDIVDLAKGLQLAAEAVEDNRKDIDANKADIEIAKKAAVEAEKSAKSVQGSVEVAQKSAETAESHAKAAKTSADAANNVASAAQTAAAQAQDAVKANASQVAANKADIATLQTASNQHAAGIAKNSARIDSLDKNVANLRKETRQGLAAQAALSGLFQPYSVGKFNVTAALGGFKSDTAVAVGAGYRFNENFAAKAGLAVGTSSGGSASYNVGVNYEW